ncbi:UDP-glucose 4-epimerase GalE [Mariprofundus sp. EBB-1]|uniref:UDP-glucose 4-epimerase GalE n=1 Tax=Mariprofundus sp. EBB-1 TaxID=2650971 RepID=UPI000EF25C38|nr:UDP-glucose 4-epimerase GalE [Mariprofundus sp. EBB-1]RLL55880.1 UDP-glucose 4-epimerase GalE [Mariprofundus sp. EBB-1]
MNILVVGGAGYIGSHMVKALGEKGCNITVLDNLSSGHADAVLAAGQLIEGDLANVAMLDQLFAENNYDVVMHFASSIMVGESVTDPAKYYRNNVSNTQNLLDAMIKHGVKQFIFSSTAAIFGEPEYTPIDEKHPKAPINPYGHSKQMVEQMLEDYDRAYGLKSVCLRYFNAAGADPEGELGERHDPETHLIPLVLQAASGKRDAITVFGRDYDTEDGTCIRDYIHVNDLCEAHWLAIKQLQNDGKSGRFNLGNGNGFSVQQVIDVCRDVTGKEITIIEGARRAGDPAVLVADATLARSELGWEPQYNDLKSIVSHAWEWEKNHC